MRERARETERLLSQPISRVCERVCMSFVRVRKGESDCVCVCVRARGMSCEKESVCVRKRERERERESALGLLPVLRTSVLLCVSLCKHYIYQCSVPVVTCAVEKYPSKMRAYYSVRTPF